ncbi:aspartate:alanine exchanger family transporter [Sanguibacter sp. HDW7]|uniref:aspartate:alanine exchanger family transporter n=1 Tax=Sanguibacter sp. HDW7 TaxID=2714931 RepID=UPI00140CB2C6|nr:TrkA C-terminal domain-containing protein [Sanguibacter sp. HDW7]QIK82312.1 transporter [Sanguibacter sp. HDW7]
MDAVLSLLVEQPVLLLVLLVGIGAAIGHIRVRGVGLGAAAVLFCALLLGALGASREIDLEVPHAFGTLGLTLFTFTVGIVSGAEFFASLRRSLKVIGWMIVVVAAGAGVAVGLGRLLDLSTATIAGTFAGALTNTPALAAARDAAGDDAAPTVGYAVAYVFGVVGVLIVAHLTLRSRGNDTDAPPELVERAVRVEFASGQSVRELTELYGERIAFSRLRSGSEDAAPRTALDDDVLVVGDVVTVVGPERLVEEIVAALGHVSSHQLRQDGRVVAMRRITVSSTKVAGRTLEELELHSRYGAVVTRLRRGDVDEVANSRTVLRLGDRVRIVAPRGHMGAITTLLGDSTRGFSDINPAVLGLGMALGVLLGLVVLPIPGVHVTIGAAAGTLVMGLVLGRLGRVGPFSTSMSFTAAQALSELGLLIFLAQAGLVAGGQVAPAFASGEWLRILALGAAVTTTVAVGLWCVLRRLCHVGATTASGMIAGTQTQPAVLAFANVRTGFDPRVALGYALVYPAAMIVKIVAGGILGSL